VRYDLEAADGEPGITEPVIVKTETVKRVTTEKKQEEFCGRRAVNPEDCISMHGPTFNETIQEFIEWLACPFGRNADDK
jgi:uncharacterized protein YktB (UPF0637 family)